MRWQTHKHRPDVKQKHSSNMKRIIIAVSVICFLLTGVKGQSIFIDSVSVNPFGKVFIYSTQREEQKNIIIMISGDGGWKYGVTDFAREFARTGSLVVGVDILKYYRHLRQEEAGCYMVSPDFVELSNTIEQKYSFKHYVPPVIMGYSSGATLVYGILAQARPGTYIGGISLGFCADFELPQMLCQINGLSEEEIEKGKSYQFMPGMGLGNPWIALHGEVDKVCDFKKVSDFVSNTSNARLISLPSVGHGFSRWSDFMPQWKSAYSEMISRYSTDQAQAVPAPDSIPCVIVREKTAAESNLMAILFSGDGGWYGFEQSISRHLAEKGIPVVGIDTRKYFWNRRSPEKTASDMTDILKFYEKEWNKTGFILIGYSQGAEIVPFVLSRLPEDQKSRAASLVMLSPDTRTDFEIHLSNMLGIGNKQNTYNVIKEISGIKKTKQIIIYGENEKTEVPELLRNTEVEIVRIPGDHHFKGNSALIVQMMEEKRAF